VVPRNHVLDVDPDIRKQMGNFRGKDMPEHSRRHSAVSYAKMTEPIEMPFGLWTRVGPRKRVLHRGSRWRDLVNTTEQSVFCGPAKMA